MLYNISIIVEYILYVTTDHIIKNFNFKIIPFVSTYMMNKLIFCVFKFYFISKINIKYLIYLKYKISYIINMQVRVEAATATVLLRMRRTSKLNTGDVWGSRIHGYLINSRHWLFYVLSWRSAFIRHRFYSKTASFNLVVPLSLIFSTNMLIRFIAQWLDCIQ
jgi:hypothetical protein